MDMKRWIIRTAASLIAAAVLFSVTVFAKTEISAVYGVLMDAQTNQILWERRMDEPALIASTTKIMTGLLVSEHCCMDDVVTISKEAVGVEGSSLYLQEGEQRTVEELLYGMMLHSGNDAATALALHCSGSLDAFVEQMNRKADTLQLCHTQFANPHGLDSKGNYASAQDLAKLTACAMENPIFHRVVGTKTIAFENRSYTNHNKLLWSYDGAIGVKTGYTRQAGRILVSSAERNGRRLIAVTIDAPDDWQDHRNLLDMGFSRYTEKQLVSKDQVFSAVPVMNGEAVAAEAVAAEDFSWATAEDEEIVYQCNVPAFEYAPIMAGDMAGTVQIRVNGVVVGEVPLVWRTSVWEES